MKKVIILIVMLVVTFANGQTLYSCGFDSYSTMISEGWSQTNQSAPVGPGNWLIPSSQIFAFWEGAQGGGVTSLIYANYNSVGNSSVPATISNWLITPSIEVKNGDVVSFYSRKGGYDIAPIYPDRLQFRMSTDPNTVIPSQGIDDLGSFTTLCLDINPNLTTTDYPLQWTYYTYVVTGLDTLTECKFAFRYYVTNAGPFGTNSDTVGIDTFSVYRSLSNGSFSKKTFSIYPNPANQELNFNIGSLVLNSVDFIDVDGKLVKRINNLDYNNTSIGISDLNSGMYLVKAYTDQGIQTTKLIKR